MAGSYDGLVATKAACLSLSSTLTASLSLSLSIYLSIYLYHNAYPIFLSSVPSLLPFTGVTGSWCLVFPLPPFFQDN